MSSQADLKADVQVRRPEPSIDAIIDTVTHLLLLALLQSAAVCGADAAAAAERARQFVWALDLPTAIREYAVPARVGCADARTAVTYLNGLRSAREAYPAGGSETSLKPVRSAIDLLEARAGGDPLAAIARVTLMAALVGAQSERDDMGLLLEQAAFLEKRLIAAKGTPLPLTAHEVAGDLWLQVHRFEEARKAYQDAASLIGPTPRIAVGLARTAVRLKDVPAACRSYRDLLELWGTRTAAPPEVLEARTFVDERGCAR